MDGKNTLDDIRVVRINSTADTLTVDFDDGRTVNLPLIWYPRLFRATQAQREHYELMGKGYGVHWPAVDEDLSAKSLARRLLDPLIARARVRPEDFGVTFPIVIKQSPVHAQRSGIGSVYQAGGIAGAHLEQHAHLKFTQSFAAQETRHIIVAIAGSDDM